MTDEEKYMERWRDYSRNLLNHSRPETSRSGDNSEVEIQLNTKFVWIAYIRRSQECYSEAQEQQIPRIRQLT